MLLYLAVCQISAKLVTSKIFFILTTYKLSTVVMLSQKKFDSTNLLRGDTSNIVPNLGSLGLVLDTFPDGQVACWVVRWSGEEWIKVLAQTKLSWSLLGFV